MAAVSNFGNSANRTGHVFAAYNTFAFGRLAWDPFQDTAKLGKEWAQLTFGGGYSSRDHKVVNLAVNMLSGSWENYEMLTSPLGAGGLTWNFASGPCKPRSAKSKTAAKARAPKR